MFFIFAFQSLKLFKFAKQSKFLHNCRMVLKSHAGSPVTGVTISLARRHTWQAISRVQCQNQRRYTQKFRHITNTNSHSLSIQLRIKTENHQESWTNPRIFQNQNQTQISRKIHQSSEILDEYSSPDRFSSQFQCEFITIGDELKHDHEGEEEGMRTQGIRTNWEGEEEDYRSNFSFRPRNRENRIRIQGFRRL